ncbi:aldose epimerase family protein [Aquimarina gracilis]|uniref:Aldose 1-epimerase n=1 Tax=Aquimarina gracilis TaxID=874422 RepID=A0ABU5ZSE1_9FLAO|nr:aldose epimerase family protein [Aquimarina gracilis]MEB3344721.1 aldose epimerase family protein [Aquimarina gracilis]
MRPSKTKSGLQFEDFEKEIDGKQTGLFVLSNNNGLEAAFTNFGQRLVSLLAPDRNGVFDDIVLGHSTLEEYLYPESEHYFGAIIGRYANRIANGKLVLEGKKHFLIKNNEPNHLHGGTRGFHKVVWETDQISNNKIEFSYISEHLEEGYPGNLKVKVTYILTENDELKINYFATSDKTTIINLTHHSYFNLNGEGNGTVEDHIVRINADYYTPINKSMIPTGEIAPVRDTVMDFSKSKPLGKDIEDNQLTLTKGYDHNFVLSRGPFTPDQDLIFAAQVEDPNSGRVLEVYTTEPGLQLYSGNFLNGKTKGKSNLNHSFRRGLCLETQHFPDSPNQIRFPDVILKPGRTYRSSTVYHFENQQKKPTLYSK